MRRLLLLSLFLLGIGLPTISPLAPAQAGSGSANSCTDGARSTEYTHETPILTSPITLALQTNNKQSWYPDEPIYRICYSTSPAGYSGNDTVGGSIDIGQPDEPYSGYTGTNVECNPQSNPSAIAPYCYVGMTEEHYPFLTNYEPRRYTIPIVFCAPTCVTASQEVGWTGLIIDGWDVHDAQNPFDDLPAGTTLGATATVPAVTLCVYGTCQPVSRQDVGAGVTEGGTFPVCFLACVPTGTNIGTDRPIVAVQVGSTVIPVTSPTRVCVSPYDVVVGQPYYCN